MTRQAPFQGMSTRGWVNLALAAIAVFYVATFALDVLWGNTCGHLGTDFCAFWSAGHVASQSGYAQVYDLDALGRVELSNFPAFGDPSTFAVSPFAYLPVFVLPFQLFALLSPALAFWLWTAINIGAFVLYLRFFNSRTLDLRLPDRLLLMMSLSLPAYWNFLDGQVNVWLMICIGEFLRLMLDERPFPAGLWLGGLLLKPQALLLLGPVILIRERKAFVGLAVTSVALLGASALMVQRAGAEAMLRVWLGFSQGMPTNDVDSMMNWRMIGFHLSSWLTPAVGSLVVILGIVLTVVAAVYIWRRPINHDSPTYVAAVLGTLAATGLVAWHSHIHMAMILMPPLLFLVQRDWESGPFVADKWVLVPVAGYVLVYLLAAMIKADLLPAALGRSINFVRGFAEFAMNAWLLLIVVRLSRRGRLAA